jgi:uncharacterized membrane-anchored protein YitT (DUF2179 family)
MLEALGRRLRRNYIWIYLVLGLAWFAKLGLQPEAAATWDVVVQRAAIGPVPGWSVVMGVLIFLGLALTMGIFTVGLHEASGEVLPRFIMSLEGLDWGRAWFRHSSRRRQLMALIITDQAQTVADRILSDMKRGVTGLPGVGMYTGKEHTVLMCALTVTEVGQLKSLVSAADQNAFVIVSPAQEILGRGFNPLKPV